MIINHIFNNNYFASEFNKIVLVELLLCFIIRNIVILFMINYIFDNNDFCYYN